METFSINHQFFVKFLCNSDSVQMKPKMFWLEPPVQMERDTAFACAEKFDI